MMMMMMMMMMMEAEPLRAIRCSSYGITSLRLANWLTVISVLSIRIRADFTRSTDKFNVYDMLLHVIVGR